MNIRRKQAMKVARKAAAPEMRDLGVAQARTPYGQVAAFAGDPSDMIRTMRSGTFADVIPGLASRLGITQDALFRALRLPHSTMKARISKNDTLSASEQDRLYRTEKVFARTLAVLEDEAAAKAWLVQDNRSLGGEAPLALLDTEAGYELVLDTLGRIEYGIVA
jgi:putative toxin-antitoxin system antitoxin component (TIGR02293 family)